METGDCQDCRDYRPCIGKDWYHYGEIRWCPYQCIWILQNSSTLESGEWPDQVDYSTGQRQRREEASYVKPILILAELRARLQRTGVYGELLETQIEDGRSYSNLSKNAKAVLMYVKGRKRKRMSFKKWLRDKYHGERCENRTLAMVI